LQSLGLHNVAISVLSIEISAAWYIKVLGFKLLRETTSPAVNARVAFLQKDDFNIELLNLPQAHKIDAVFADPPEHLYPIGYKAIVFEVDDLTLVTQELENLRVRIMWKEQVLDASTGLKSTMIRDPDGNYINIFQRA
jgi:catechol 2,3-dioxygenase-like lactoylglutathione lyase family enzyme